MKKFLTIAVIVLAVGVAALWGWGQLQVNANDEALVEIKKAPNVIVLQVDGMT